MRWWGGLAAAGRLDTFTDWVLTLTQRDVLRLIDPTLGPGLVKAERVIGRVSEILDGALIEDLPTPFTAVAADIVNRKEVWFQRGPVDVAIRASIAIPSVITPVMVNGRLLADGALLNPLPVEPTTAVFADCTVAVSLSGPHPAERGALVQESAAPTPGADLLERFRRGAEPMVDSALVRSLQARFARSQPVTRRVTEGFTELPGDLRAGEVINLSLETMQDIIERFRIAANPPDVLIRVPSRVCSPFDFHRAAEIMEAGRTLAREACDRAGL